MKALAQRILNLPWPVRAVIVVPLFPLVIVLFLIAAIVGVAEAVLEDMTR